VAQAPPKGPKASIVTEEAIRVRASIDLAEIVSRLQNEDARLIADYSQRGLTGPALANAVTSDLEAMFGTSLERTGREATHEAFALGRNLEAQSQADSIGGVVRSAILDENSCPPCVGLDGQTYTFNSADYFNDMPPNHCDGGEQCRCLYIYRSAA